MAIEVEIGDGVGELIINAPPVNALNNAGWKEFARKLTELGRRDDVHCVVIRAEGRGFQAGVDVKELAEHGDLIVELNRGCYDSFAAVYDCPVPTISAVHGFCIGGGIGIAGASDFVIASEDATFQLPEIDRGALGAATHLMRLVGVQKARRMLYTCEAIGAAELYRLGGCESVVPREKLRDEVMAVARSIAAKSPKALRLGKQALNGIELLDVKQSYRFEQGFTLEL
ncbi:MAG TPA: enoyl-CoA hydratase family protein, partial [Myxococcota bacterium]|nr:enoyl-CoA hydratase family protein [Myxococcota bacterium]